MYKIGLYDVFRKTMVQSSTKNMPKTPYRTKSYPHKNIQVA